MDLIPEWNQVCPWLPDGASEWEAQEIRRHWRNALVALEQVSDLARAEADSLLQRGRHKVPADYVPDYRHDVSGGGLGNYAAQAEASMVAMSHVRNGCLHRLAILQREADEAASLEEAKETLDLMAGGRLIRRLQLEALPADVEELLAEIASDEAAASKAAEWRRQARIHGHREI